MQYKITTESAEALNTGVLILPIFQPRTLIQDIQIFDEISEGYLSKILTRGDIKGEIGETLLLQDVANLVAERVLLVGCGEGKKALTVMQYKKIVTSAAKALQGLSAESAVSLLDKIEVSERGSYWKTRFFVETFADTNYTYDEYKTKKSPVNSLKHITLQVKVDKVSAAEKALAHSQAISCGMKATRDVANCPPNVCTPAYLAQQAQALTDSNSLMNLDIIDEAQMAELSMNAYLAVSSGSQHDAMMSIMHFNNHPNKDAKPIVLVGKGLTFDAGGISLKPAANMDEMKYDMGGAATVLGVMHAVAKLQLPLNIIGVMAGCENLPDGKAYRPGDILTSMSGQTIEVLNTDAEGRLVLCDALTYVERFDPAQVIDIATLTGACVVALGQHNSGLLTNDETMASALLNAAAQADDKAWRLPLSEEYTEQLKSTIADMANIGGPWGGASTAGAFLAHYTKNYPWAHLDIAGTAWRQGANKGATGRAVALLVQHLLNQL